MELRETYHEEDDAVEPIGHLVEHRVPWLFVGLLGGLLTAVIVSKYEAILSANIQLAFFIPIIGYLSDEVGTQAEIIYVRALAHKKKVLFRSHLLKESAIGVTLGIIFGAIIGFSAAYWLSSPAIGFTIGLTMFINLSIAPVLAVCVSSILHKYHTDPALGSGPMATVIQYAISLLIYFAIANIIIF